MKLYDRAVAWEKENGKTLQCGISKFPCKYCPVCLTNKCPHLELYLKEGRWK